MNEVFLLMLHTGYDGDTPVGIFTKELFAIAEARKHPERLISDGGGRPTNSEVLSKGWLQIHPVQLNQAIDYCEFRGL